MKGALALLIVACGAPAAVPVPVPPPAEAAPPPIVNEPAPEPVTESVPAPVVPVAKPIAPVAADTRSCAARGGKLQPVCMGGIVECVIRYRDAGKRCSDKKDCTGDCLFVGTNAPPPGTAATGKCQTTSDSCGCAARVVAGRVKGVECLD